jgi:glycosyltransferase involved in cell wall biosynthesis
MRILLDASFALRGASGTSVYIQRLAPALEAEGVEVSRAQNDSRRPPGGGAARSVANLAADTWWNGIELSRRARRSGCDVLHHPLPARALAPGCPQVVTVHDLAFEAMPERFARGYRVHARRAHRAAARRAAAVICVSQATADEAIAVWGLDEARVVVAHHGPGQEPAPAGSRDAPRHFLYVGDDEPRKNLGLLLAAYARYRAQLEAASRAPLPLVLAGRARAEGAGVESAGEPDVDALQALYADAAALVHPALHEGFGLTPLEAMTAGAPVVAVRSAAVSEVCDDAAIYVQAGDGEALAHELFRLHDDDDLRRRLSSAGRARAASFSWRASARAHIAAYTLAMGHMRQS